MWSLITTNKVSQIAVQIVHRSLIQIEYQFQKLKCTELCEGMVHFVRKIMQTDSVIIWIVMKMHTASVTRFNTSTNKKVGHCRSVVFKLCSLETWGSVSDFRGFTDKFSFCIEMVNIIFITLNAIFIFLSIFVYNRSWVCCNCKSHNSILFLWMCMNIVLKWKCMF